MDAQGLDFIITLQELISKKVFKKKSLFPEHYSYFCVNRNIM